MMNLEKVRLLFVQYMGDYRETLQRLDENGKETYRAQKYSVDAVAEIGKKIEEATVLCCVTTETYNEVLKNGVRAIGTGFDEEFQVKELIKLIEEQKPSHIVVRTPIRGVFRWAIQNEVETLAALADSFPDQGLKNKLRNYLLANLLNHKRIRWVGNHGVNASMSLQKLGVKPEKILPYDYPDTLKPDLFSPKILSSNVNSFGLVYVGLIDDLKGVGDILEAVAILRTKNFPVNLKIAGRGKIDFFASRARQLQIEDCVEFLGLVSNDSVVPLMRDADIVLVPSRHEYPEGIPLTIYEGLCSRTPIIASDHPMFKTNLKHGINAMIFAAGNPMALSECIEKLLADSNLYQSLSVASYAAWEQLQIPVKWADMINCWLDNSSESSQWLFEHRLASGRYN